jgi:hypothetical protein
VTTRHFVDLARLAGVSDVMRVGVAASLTESVTPTAAPRAKVDDAPPSLVRVSGGQLARSPVATRSSMTTSASGRKCTG